MTYLVLLAFVLICFRNWFFPGYIAAGDLWPAAADTIRSISLIPVSWNGMYGGGMGASTVPYLWNYIQYAAPLYFLGHILQLPWEYIVRFGYLFPFLVITIISSYTLAKHFVGSFFAWIGSLIYTVNTYSLLIISGGQTGVAFGYGLAPYVLLRFINAIDASKEPNLKQGIKNGIWVALLITFDLRLTYLVLAAVFLYYVFSLKKTMAWRFLLRRIVFLFIIPCSVAASLHLFWILPALQYGGVVAGLGDAYTNSGMLKFLSVADFSHTLSLLHPNWPENLFGKVYFLQPEFLGIPLLAFFSLLFLKKAKNKQHILFFALLALIGAFFAKGTNEPFGGMFIWLFSHMPGFVLFRDPTKFYLFVALGYSILIPYGLQHIGTRWKKGIWIAGIVFMVFWGVTVRESLTGSVGGTLHAVSVPDEYLKFEKQIRGEDNFFRVLWVPATPRFAFSTMTHPSADALTLMKESSASGVIARLKTPDMKEQLARWSVNYIAVPIDKTGEFFATDRTYDDGKRREVIEELDTIPWLERQRQYETLAVWKTTAYNNHFWIGDGSGTPFKMENPTGFTLTGLSVKKGAAVTMSENFSPLWSSRFGNSETRAGLTGDGLNEFIAPHDYAGEVTIRYIPQSSLMTGLWIDGIAVLLYCVLLIVL